MPLLWVHITVTAVMVVLLLLIIRSQVFRVFSIVIVIVSIAWLVGFINRTLRVTVSADTTGPPAGHRQWVLLKRRGTERRIGELMDAIHRGNDAKEPDGTRLVEI